MKSRPKVKLGKVIIFPYLGLSTLIVPTIYHFNPYLALFIFIFQYKLLLLYLTTFSLIYPYLIIFTLNCPNLNIYMSEKFKVLEVN